MHLGEITAADLQLCADSISTDFVSGPNDLYVMDNIQVNQRMSPALASPVTAKLSPGAMPHSSFRALRT
jgi:hypothetical protein